MKIQLLSKCRDLISVAKTDEALEILSETSESYSNEILILSNRWFELKRQRIAGTITQDLFEKERNDVNNSILIVLHEMERELKKHEHLSKKRKNHLTTVLQHQRF